MVIVWLAVTIYAIADWARTPEEQMPGRIPRLMWLVIILLTIPSFSIGSIVWLIVRAVSRAEGAQGGSGGERRGGPLFPRAGQRPTPTAPTEPLAPDDDPEFLFRLERDIRRRRAEEDRARASGAAAPQVGPGSGADGGSDGTGGRPEQDGVAAEDGTSPTTGDHDGPGAADGTDASKPTDEDGTGSPAGPGDATGPHDPAGQDDASGDGDGDADGSEADDADGSDDDPGAPGAGPLSA